MIPDGLYVCHHCDNRACVNPDHMFLGTANDNRQDCCSKNRQARQRGEAQGGHKLTNEKVEYLRSLPVLRVVDAKRLGQEWGVSTQHLYRVRRNERWI